MLAHVLSFVLLLAPALAAHRTMNMASMKLAEDTSYQWTVENWKASFGGDYGGFFFRSFFFSSPFSFLLLPLVRTSCSLAHPLTL